MERSFYRFGAGALMAGAVLGLISNLLHPRSGDGTTIRGHLELVADSGIWTLDHIAIGIAVGLASLGLVAVGRSIIDASNSPWAWLWLFSLASSTALLLAVIGLDAWPTKEVAENWANAQGPAKEAAFATADAVATMTFGLLFAAIGAHFGVTGMLAGMALLNSDYPRNLAYMLLFAGALGFLTAVITFADGPSKITLNVLFPISSILFTIGGFWAGWVLWKRTETGAAPASTQGTLTT
jgi:hypothetical protein